MIITVALSGLIVIPITSPKEDVATCLASRTAIFTSASVIQYHDRIQMVWGRGIPPLTITDRTIETADKFGHIPEKILRKCANSER